MSEQADDPLVPAKRGEFKSLDGIFRATMRDEGDMWQMAIRRQLRIAACDDMELVKPSESTAAFNALAKYALYQPERQVDVNVGVQHRLGLGAEALGALGIKATRMVERLPDGTTQVHEEYALGNDALLVQTEDEDGDGGS